MTMPENEHVSKTNLSNELICEILELFDGCHAQEAFSNLNTQFNHLINCPPRLLKLNLSFISKSIFERRCQEIIGQQSNIDRIVSLRLSSEFAINHFLKLFSIDAFIRLESLVLDRIKSDELESVLTHLALLSRRFSLSIDVNSHFQDENSVYRLIFCLPVATYCKLTFEGGGECISPQDKQSERKNC